MTNAADNKSKQTADENTDINFEAQLDELTQLVAQLESGHLSLEESLKVYENAINLTRQCQNKLNNAEQRIAVIGQQHKTDNL